MTHSYPLKNLPTPVQLLIRPMLLISLGLHGLLLFLPTGAERNPIVEKEETVKITQLPSSSKPAAKPASKSAAKPAAKKVKPARRAVAINRPRAIVTPAPRIEPRQASAAGEQARRELVAASASGETSGTDQQAEASGAESPFADFPHYSGAEPGCFGKESCQKTADPLGKVDAHFAKQLPAKKYQVQSVSNEADKKVYQVSKGGATQFLNLFTSDGGTVYVLAPEPLNSLDDLKAAVEVPEGLYVTLSKLGGEPADDTNFDDPDNFFAKLSSEDEAGSVLAAELRSEIDGSPQLVSGQTPEKVYNGLQPQLQSNGIEISEVKPYGGGSLYKLHKGSFTGYLNLVPSKDRTGTIVVVWTGSPN